MMNGKPYMQILYVAMDTDLEDFHSGIPRVKVPSKVGSVDF
jgi:hypothetical protein